MSAAILRCVASFSLRALCLVRDTVTAGEQESRRGLSGSLVRDVVHRSRLSSSIITFDAVRVQGRP